MSQLIIPVPKGYKTDQHNQFISYDEIKHLGNLTNFSGNRLEQEVEDFSKLSKSNVVYFIEWVEIGLAAKKHAEIMKAPFYSLKIDRTIIPVRKWLKKRDNITTTAQIQLYLNN
ncbi:hypothetical protein CMI40_00525 [Candidatus Pacearchaeota archaeon]|mgnify:CR=1 FL=1|jgi:hypothetical protein|nr:hypothetical protein [Candidatus Pacearchaeota archaeon]|tara:strand:- start:8770 stop:9111 length:342 start_codon:yes stop_codon:yes gene_type:complete